MKVRFRVVRKKEKREICGVQVKYEQYPKIVAQKREEEKREKITHKGQHTSILHTFSVFINKIYLFLKYIEHKYIIGLILV